MIIWTHFIDVLTNAFTFVAQTLNGKMGLAILAVSLAMRFALLPLSVRITRGTLLRGRKLAQLAPTLEAIKAKHRGNPQRLSQETLELYKRNDIKLIDATGLLGGILQAPIFIGMFTAIRAVIATGQRFLWMDLARPDALLTMGAAALTYAATAATPGLPNQARSIMTYLPVFLTILFLWNLSSESLLF